MAPNQKSVEATGLRFPAASAAASVVESLYQEFDGYGLNCETKRNMTNEQGIDSVKIDVLEVSRNRDIKLVAKDDPDATENSSSFADTISGNEDSSTSDAEVESHLSAENDHFDRLSSMSPARKKKMTTHWRSFIHPLMWRCKWMEIKIKQLESQSSKYARYVAAYDRKKHTASHQVIEQSGSRSVPYTYRGRQKRPMKRIKRRKEDTTDVALYMSNHNLFSQRENMRDHDGVLALEDPAGSDQTAAGNGDFGLNEDCLFLENSSDNFLEQILSKIESVHTRVQKLKSQIDTVMINNAGRFSSSENLSENLACEVQHMSFIQSPTLSACNGDMGGLHMVEYDLGDFNMPGSAVSSFGEAAHVPDIIESTVGLLSSIDVTQPHVQIGDSSEKILENIMVHNDVAELEGSTYKTYCNPSAYKGGDAEISGEESNNNAINMAFQSTLKSCLASEIHFPKNKRKRGERKAGSSNWNRQRPGEPDC